MRDDGCLISFKVLKDAKARKPNAMGWMNRKIGNPLDEV